MRIARHASCFFCNTLATRAVQAVRRAGLQGLHGLQGTSNVTGDEQKKARGCAGAISTRPAKRCQRRLQLDVISNDIFINSLKYTGLVGLIVSEENEAEIVLSEHPDARYVVVTDPLVSGETPRQLFAPP